MTCAHRTYYTERGERCRLCGKTTPYSAERRKKQIESVRERNSRQSQVHGHRGT